MPTTELSPAEVAHITGHELAYMQRRELKRRGWLFETNAKGEPIVGRAYADARLGGPTAAKVRVAEKSKVNLEHV